MLFHCLLLLQAIIAAVSTPLDDYVWKYDENYNYVDMGPDYVIKGGFGNRGWTGYTLNMTSQRWLTDADFSADSQAHSIWWHYLVVIIPDEVKYTTNASLWITGGSMGSSPPKATDEDIIVSAALAASTGVITGALFQIPNEHVTFSADPIQKSRTEDAVIAFTWDHFLKDPSQPEWLLRFPMVKASLRAMDTITDFVAKQFPELNTKLDYYSVAGASKRGWTTWDVAAVDTKRVAVAVPIVLDAINFTAVEHHQYRSYGGWTYALQDYIDENITVRFDSPNMVLLQENVDPFFYRDRLTMPKLVINAFLDEFQQPDDTHYWWSEMPGPKHFIMTPNAEHSLATGILLVVPAASAFIQANLEKRVVPTFEWTISEETGEIVVTLDEHGVVYEANLWYGYSCGTNAWDNTKRRDFRIAHLDNPCECGIFVDGYCTNLKSAMAKKPLESEMVGGKRTYRAQVDAPEDGRWVAFFVEIKYVNPNPFPFARDELLSKVVRREGDKAKRSGLDIAREVAASQMAANGDDQTASDDFSFGGFPHDFGRFMDFTTEVSVWPNTFPYEDCYMESCGSTVV